MITANESIERLAPYFDYQKHTAFQSNTGNVVRFMIEDNAGKIKDVFVFIKGSGRRGYRFSPAEFLNAYTLLEKRDEGVEWKKRLKRAIKLMNESGLWQNVKEVYQNLYEHVTFEEKKKIYRDYFSIGYCRTEEEKAKEKAFLDGVKARFPFMIKQDEQGKDYLNTEYIFELSDCKLKSMYFGKRDNERYKAAIEKAIKEKTAYSIPRIVVNYDVSFEYNSDKNMAWYSEEYRDCGNGHYYLALNHSTALFCEDD